MLIGQYYQKNYLKQYLGSSIHSAISLYNGLCEAFVWVLIGLKLQYKECAIFNGSADTLIILNLNEAKCCWKKKISLYRNNFLNQSKPSQPIKGWYKNHIYSSFSSNPGYLTMQQVNKSNQPRRISNLNIHHFQLHYQFTSTRTKDIH